MKRWNNIYPVFRNRIFFLLALSASWLPLSLAFQSRSIDVVSTSGARVEAQAGKLLTLSFRVSNNSPAKKRLESFVSAPAGWRRLAKDFPFELDAAASDIRLLSISVPSETPAGEYTVRYGLRDAANPSDVSEVPVTVVITPLKDQTLKLVESPRMAVAGDAYNVTFLLTNKGNITTLVRLFAQSSNRFVTKIDSSVMHMRPGESRTVSVKVQTDDKIPARVQDILDFAAELDSANTAHATSFVEVVPRITGDEEQFVTFPLQATARFAGEQGKNGGQIEVAGTGSLAALRGGSLDVLVRTPDIQSKSVLGQRDEYRIGYTVNRRGYALSQYSLFVGDRNFSLSPLTELNRYAFGFGGTATVNSITAGAFYNKMRFGTPNQQEWAGFLTYQPNESASFSANYLGKDEQSETSVFSLRSLVRPFRTNEVDLEYGVGRNGNQTDQAYDARWSMRENWISSEIQYLHAGPAYTGYYRDVDFKNVSLNLAPLKDLRFEAYYRDEDRNLKRDSTLLLAPHNRYVLVGAGYSSIVSVYYRVNDQEDLLPVSHFKRGDKTWQLRLTQNLFGLTLVGNADVGTIQDDLIGNSSSYERYGVFASVQPFQGQTYGMTAEYTKEKDLTTLLPQELLAGSLNASVLIGEGTQVSAALSGTKTQGSFNQTYSLFDASVQHRFSGGQTLTVRGRQSIFAPSEEGKELAYLAELSIPIAVPLARKTATGRLTGKVVDSEKGTGIQGVLVYAGGATALTDRNGEYHFVSLKPDKYYVQLDMASIGLNRVALQQLPHEVTVVGAQELRYDISLTRAISVSGVALLFGMKDQAPGDTSQPQMIEQGGHPNVILELSNAEESSRRVSDSRGRFGFAGIRPGKWTLQILEGNLPQNYHFEKESYIVDAPPGTSMELTFKAIPRKRRIQILQQGKTLEAAPLKNRSNEIAPKKSKSLESVPSKPKTVPETSGVTTKEPTPASQQRERIQVPCTIVFVSERMVFAIEHSRWPTKKMADSVEASIERKIRLPAFVDTDFTGPGTKSYRVLLGVFASRKQAEAACAEINRTQ